MRIADLPPQQHHIAMLTLKACSPTEIAGMLGIRPKTVHTQKELFRRKLGIDNDLQLFALAVMERMDDARDAVAAVAAVRVFIEEAMP